MLGTPKETAIELIHKFKSHDLAYLCTEEIVGALYEEGIREDNGTRPFWYSVQNEIDLNNPMKKESKIKQLQIALLKEKIEKLTNKKVRLVEFIDAPPVDIDVPYNKKKGYHIINNDDFELRYDIVGDSLQLMWIINKTGKYKGEQILGSLIAYAKSKGLHDIYAWWCKGTIDKVPATGYYIGMKWGFDPVDGVEFVNKVLGSHYKSMEEARQDPEFLPLWKAKGRDFTGTLKVK